MDVAEIFVNKQKKHNSLSKPSVLLFLFLE